MNKFILTTAAASIFALAPLTHAGAQMSNMLNNTMNSTSSGMSMPGMGSMGSMSLPSVTSASPTNLAGLLQYCVQNNYLGGGSADAASSAKESLLSKFTGSSSDPTSNTGFTSGSNGVLDTGNGQSTTLGGSGIKAQVTQKVCSQVLSHAKSIL
jgi:hypothetical protein